MIASPELPRTNLEYASELLTALDQGPNKHEVRLNYLTATSPLVPASITSVAAA